MVAKEAMGVLVAWEAAKTLVVSVVVRISEDSVAETKEA